MPVVLVTTSIICAGSSMLIATLHTITVVYSRICTSSHDREIVYIMPVVLLLEAVNQLLAGSNSESSPNGI
ncbi:hypothetical protein BDY19DRAFT_979757 [Irpex rosettiformis]|uniref:Uncharacterized protein n=1 Tax=Irpex rosettiformis TaxID=378272 RepID=A0ACB8TMN1_9APHY|nr:hypothetical protein BDY19DRAFT_979757 [Irpex rosettiformis]